MRWQGGAFEGIASKKKAAQRAALTAALGQLSTAPAWVAAMAYSAVQLPESVLEALEKSLNDEASCVSMPHPL